MISMDFSKIKLKKASVKVPKLKTRDKSNEKAAKKQQVEIPISSIVSILIKAAVEKAKRDEKEKAKAEESKSYTAIKESRIINLGGYGTVYKIYGVAPHAPYIDYGKLFSYLGRFRAQGSFENFAGDNPAERINKIMEQGNKFYLIDNEVRDDGVRSIKYFTHGVLTGAPSAVPIGGISSGDWEKFKIWMIVDYVMFNLKMSTL